MSINIEKNRKLALVVDMYGCPNRCRHCWLGRLPNIPPENGADEMLFSFALVMLRTLYAKWLYRKSAAERIRRIRAEFPDAAQRRAVLSAQGGVSIAGVIGAFVLLMVLGACATVLMGPNLDALAGMI